MVRLPESDSVPRLGIFEVELEVFQGPFDLLLQLIARRQLDITEVALAQVTDEFIAHMKRVPDLSTTTEFLVVAATLLEMKAAQLLPQTERDPAMEEDLSARDLLFSRLLQYRAFKAVADSIRQRLSAQAGALARTVTLEPHFTQLLPELVWNTTPQRLAVLAAASLTEKPRPDEAEHVNRPQASLDEELDFVEKQLAASPRTTFTELIRGADNVAVIVTRFLAILELFRRGCVRFTQPVELGPLEIEWLPSPLENAEPDLSRTETTHEDQGLNP